MSKTPFTIITDILVCGGGCAGLGAALASARNGAKTLLIERAGFAGGIITAVGLPCFDGIADLREKRIVVRGIPLELYVKMGGCEPNATHVSVHYAPITNIERFKLLADKLLTSEGNRLKVLYHSFACDAAVRGGRITEVIIANKAGLVRVRPKVVIDCTGDADVAFFAGAPTDKNKELQPMSLHFRIGNVRRNRAMEKNCRLALERAKTRGKLPIFYGPGLSFHFAPNEAMIHGVRVPADATDPEALTRAEIQGRRDAWTMFECWKSEVRGFEKSYFITSGPYIGIRETRRIVGQYVLTEKDLLTNRKFDDAVATGCWYLDKHPNRATPGKAQDTPRILPPAPYDIPYRSLLPQKISNLLVAGRCHSATHMAASSTRVTVTAMALGQAAGTAAAMVVKARKNPQEVSGDSVRKKLCSQGAAPM
jgi:hypothetical protein